MIAIHLPKQVEERLREISPDLEEEAKIALALDLFRKEKITHYELGQILGLDRFETDAFLVERKEFSQSLSLDDLESDYETLTKIMDERP